MISKQTNINKTLCRILDNPPPRVSCYIQNYILHAIYNTTTTDTILLNLLQRKLNMTDFFTSGIIPSPLAAVFPTIPTVVVMLLAPLIVCYWRERDKLKLMFIWIFCSELRTFKSLLQSNSWYPYKFFYNIPKNLEKPTYKRVNKHLLNSINLQKTYFC
jgi:hypothetical protein